MTHYFEYWWFLGSYLFGLPTFFNTGVVLRSTRYRRLLAPWITQNLIWSRKIQLLTVDLAIPNSAANVAGVTQLLSSSSMFMLFFATKPRLIGAGRQPA